MAGLRAPVRGALLMFALAIGLASAVPTLAADPRDPRCDAWEAGAPPPGTNMAAMCPAAGPRSEAIDLDKEPLIPYVVGLVVMALVLGTFGVVAMRVMAPRPQRRASLAEDWWACPSCGERNRPDRAHCFACQGSRDTVAPSASEDPHPA